MDRCQKNSPGHKAPGQREAAPGEFGQRRGHGRDNVQRESFKPLRLGRRGEGVGRRFHALQYRPAGGEGDKFAGIFYKRLI